MAKLQSLRVQSTGIFFSDQLKSIGLWRASKGFLKKLMKIANGQISSHIHKHVIIPVKNSPLNIAALMRLP